MSVDLVWGEWTAIHPIPSSLKKISQHVLFTLLPPANEVFESYVFTRVCHSVHRGGYLDRYTPSKYPPGRYTHPRQVPPSRVGTPPPSRPQCMLEYGQQVRIPLECILVIICDGFTLLCYAMPRN